MADTERSEQVELRLAVSGRDLVPAIEAAQFARVIDQGACEGPGETAAIDALIALFASAAERWGELGQAQRAALTARLGGQIDALERQGWFVHWATSTLGIAGEPRETVRLPLAVLSISRSGLPTLPARIPAELAIDPGSGAVH